MTGMLRLAAFAALPLALAVPAVAEQRPANGEAELAQILEGRVAGEPVDCIRSDASDGMQVVDETALVFRRGQTLYVNRPEGARTIDDWDLPVVFQFGSQICRQDRVEMRDRTSGIPGPSIFLGKFVPYTRSAR